MESLTFIYYLQNSYVHLFEPKYLLLYHRHPLYFSVTGEVSPPRWRLFPAMKDAERIPYGANNILHLWELLKKKCCNDAKCRNRKSRKIENDMFCSFSATSFQKFQQVLSPHAKQGYIFSVFNTSER